MHGLIILDNLKCQATFSKVMYMTQILDLAFLLQQLQVQSAEVIVVVNKRKGYIIGITVGIIGCFLTWIIMGNSLLFKNPVPYVDVLWAILHAHLYVILLMINPQSYLEDVIT